MKLIFLTLATIILVFINIYVGAVSFSFQEITAVLTGNSNDPSLRFIVFESRLPQAVTSLLAGAGLAACGLMLQTVFRNPLAGPWESHPDQVSGLQSYYYFSAEVSLLDLKLLGET